jgi:hypothetical protein
MASYDFDDDDEFENMMDGGVDPNLNAVQRANRTRARAERRADRQRREAQGQAIAFNEFAGQNIQQGNIARAIARANNRQRATETDQQERNARYNRRNRGNRGTLNLINEQVDIMNTRRRFQFTLSRETVQLNTLPRTFRQVLNRFEDQINEGFLIRFNFNDRNPMYITVQNQNEMEQNLTHIVNGLMQVEGEEWESDPENVLNLENGFVQSITFIKQPIYLRGNERRRGNVNFWRWQNLTDFDLSRYGIYKDINADNLQENCFIKALRLNLENVKHPATERYVNCAKVYLKHRTMPLYNLDLLANEIKVLFAVKRPEKKCMEYYPQPFYDANLFIPALRVALNKLKCDTTKEIVKEIHRIKEGNRIYKHRLTSLFENNKTSKCPRVLWEVKINAPYLIWYDKMSQDKIQKYSMSPNARQNVMRQKEPVYVVDLMRMTNTSWYDFYDTKIDLGIIDGHCFINDKCNFSSFALKHYFRLMDSDHVDNVDAMRYISDDKIWVNRDNKQGTEEKEVKLKKEKAFDALYRMYVYEAIYIHVDVNKSLENNLKYILAPNKKGNNIGYFQTNRKSQNEKKFLQVFLDIIKNAKSNNITHHHYMKPISLCNEVVESVEMDYDDDSILNYPKNQVKPVEDKEVATTRHEKARKVMETHNVWYFDFECYPHEIVKKIKVKNEMVDVTNRITMPYGVHCWNEEGTREQWFEDKIVEGKTIEAGQQMLEYINQHSYVKKHEENFFNVSVNGGKLVMLVAHNCAYDSQQIRKFLAKPSFLKRGTHLIRGDNGFLNYIYNGNVNKKDQCNIFPYDGKTKPMYITFVDSLNFINAPLRKFKDMFKIQGLTKEVMPHKLYTEQSLKHRYVEIEEARKLLNDDEKFQHMKATIDRLGIWENNNNMMMGNQHSTKFDIIAYAKYYCKQDVNILRQGYKKYREWCKRDYNIDINAVHTSSSLADLYFKMQDCYKGVFYLKGRPRQFIQKCCVGGRTMSRDNKMHYFDNSLEADKDDYLLAIDFVSLYATAASRMPGVLQGTPKVLENDQLNYEFLQDQDGYFVKIKITKVGKQLHFPLMSQYNEENVRYFKNDMVGEIQYVDKTTLEDYIMFQQIEFDVICGYYFNEGRNPKIREIIRKLFQVRLNYKNEKDENGNPSPNEAQSATKTILCSTYGKSIQREHEYKTISVLESDLEEFKARNFHNILRIDKIYDHTGTGRCYYDVRVKNNDVEMHKNMCQVGVEILSYSKRIMNEVMCLAEDIGVKVYYQDTDSCFIRASQYKKLIDAYNQKYTKEWAIEKYGEKYNEIPWTLEGKYMGQLHDDFDIKDDKGEKIKCTDVKATRAMFLGKKCYVCHLTGINKETKQVETCYKVRMKGVPNSTLWHQLSQLKTVEKYKHLRVKNMFDMYKLLFNKDGELNPREDKPGFVKKRKGLLGIDFDLTEGGTALRLKFHNNNQIEYLDYFYRFVTFDTPRECVIPQNVIVPSPLRDNINRQVVV